MCGGQALSPLCLPQTDLVVQAVKKDQEGDASAALSLYCKALEYFVPALHCESTRGGCVGAGGRAAPRRGRWVHPPVPLLSLTQTKATLAGKKPSGPR